MIDGNKKIEKMSIAELLKLSAMELTSMQRDYVNTILNQKRNDVYAEFVSLKTDSERIAYLLENSQNLGRIMTQSLAMFLPKEIKDWKKKVDAMHYNDLVAEKNRLKEAVKRGDAHPSMLGYVEEAVAWLSSSGAVDKDKATYNERGLKGDFSNLERHTDMYQGDERLG